ncbi:unnamed protein product [Lactuca virosa]|uniref:Uncharacterized protein n=1 Tax=Lactuca virosa TaxID=75947 RepID=A0AAU9NXB9_9ASTR|nr:unnamed protein product [Lactuca virosa]
MADPSLHIHCNLDSGISSWIRFYTMLLKREDIEDGTVMSRLAFPLLCLLLHGYGSESMKQDTLRSIVMGPKLKEIDEVIKLIHSKCYLESRKWLLVIIICKKMLLRLLQAQTIHSTFESISY